MAGFAEALTFAGTAESAALEAESLGFRSYSRSLHHQLFWLRIVGNKAQIFPLFVEAIYGHTI
jgi:hypothetical protein